MKKFTLEENLKFYEKKYWNDKKDRFLESLRPKDSSVSMSDVKGDVFHNNYLHYLETAWKNHCGVVISPDIIWHMLLCEVASLVKEDPEDYRHIFTDSPDKKEISVPSDGKALLPLDKIIAALQRLCPCDTTAFLPNFSTSNEDSVFAQYAAFADVASPYYNYSMFLCGLPSITVSGTADDWLLLFDSWFKVGHILKNSKNTKYLVLVYNILEFVCLQYYKKDIWVDMFKPEKCGSGSQYEIRGWITDLFYKKPKFALASNFSSHISIVNYKDLSTKKDYQLKSGLLSSTYSCREMTGIVEYEREEMLHPHFGWVVYDVTKEKTDDAATKN